jgi:hypothetical protein
MIDKNNTKTGDCAAFVRIADVKIAKMEIELARCGVSVDYMEPLVVDFDSRIVSIQK